MLLPQLASAGCFFGLCKGVWTGLCWTVLTDHFGQELLHKTSGLMGFAQGVMILCAPPLAGWLADRSGVSEGVFLASGGLLLLSSVFLAVWMIKVGGGGSGSGGDDAAAAEKKFHPRF